MRHAPSYYAMAACSLSATVAAFPVVGNRCPHCGGLSQQWTAGRIIAAIREWVARYGSPPTVQQWEKARPGRPSSRTVRDVFGSWRAATIAAGFTPRTPGEPRRWTTASIILAIQAWAAENGRQPSAREWTKATPEAPASQTVRAIFGTWNTAIAAAGFTPLPAHGRTRQSVRIEKPRATVEATPIVAAIQSYMGLTTPVDAVAELSGVSIKWLRRIIRTKQERIELGVADRILCAIGRPDILVDMEAS